MTKENNKILNKFDQVEIDNTSKISDTDKKYGEDLQMEYSQAVNFICKNNNFIAENTLINQFVNVEEYIEENQKTIEKIKNNFIYKVFSYFRETYRVTLDDEQVKNKYDHSVNWASLVDDIIEQLGGCSFAEKAAGEIKRNLQGSIGRYNNLDIKGYRLTISGFIDIEDAYKKGYLRISCYSKETLNKLFRAIMHFERGVVEPGNQFNYLVSYSDIPQEEILTEHDFSWNEKFKSIRFFKNSKVIIKFASSELCEQFARDYCGFVRTEVA